MSSSAADPDGTGQDPSPSASGRLVAFDSGDPTLTPDVKTGGGQNIYVKDLSTGGLSLVSLGTNGPANGDSSLPSLSRSADVIAFVSDATNLVPGGTPAGQYNVYVEDLALADPASGASVTVMPGSIKLVSQGNGQTGSAVSALDSQGDTAPDAAVLSADGSTVAFTSSAALLPGVIAGVQNVYAYTIATGALRVITATSGKNEYGSVTVDNPDEDYKAIELPPPPSRSPPPSRQPWPRLACRAVSISPRSIR